MHRNQVVDFYTKDELKTNFGGRQLLKEYTLLMEPTFGGRDTTFHGSLHSMEDMFGDSQL